MFYPVDSLKRGGRFYLCWVADSWPLRFATITHKQLWSQDIRKICDDLMTVMTNESGRPTNRFSLRLSSQLMRGLVRLYQKKVMVFLGELCMINAHVMKNANKKWNIHEEAPISLRQPQRLQLTTIPQVVIQEDPENEKRIEELIQNSGNIVSNIQDITLREPTIPEHPLPINDGFGEENPEQALAMLADRTVEFMLQGESSAIQHSGLELVDKSQDKSHDRTQDRSRIPLDVQMEKISEQDVSMFERVTGEGVLPVPDIDKEFPDIPEIPHPELPAPIPQSEKQVPAVQNTSTKDGSKETSEKHDKTLEIELEELEETEPQPKKRRLKNKLIIDKRIKLSGNFIRSRIDNPNVELRCEDSWDDIVEIRTTWDVYFGRPCHSGTKVRSNLGYKITGLFIRNLGVASTRPLAEREMEEMRERPHRLHARSVLDRIEEVEEPVHDRTHALQLDQPTEMDMTRFMDVTAPRLSVVEPEVDISELPTQKLETLSQQTRKRASEPEIVTTPKRQRSVGYMSFRLSQQLATEMNVPISEAEKENLGVEYQSPVRRPHRSTILQETSQRQDVHTTKNTEKSVTAMLQEVGLADIQIHLPMEIDQPAATTHKSQRLRSESSETLLGSLDRTKVSLGDSEQTTDSKRFIRDQWGTEGTMVKILKCIKAEVMPVTVRNLISKGPVISGHKKIIAARCFTSMLKLKQHGFINIIKNPDTLEIEGVTLGPKFD